MTLGFIIDALERLAPLHWQEEYDNSGLQVGLFDNAGMPLGRDAQVTGVLVCLDITEEVIDEAFARRCNLIVSHHPLIFRPLKAVTGAVFQQRCVAKALRLGIALYAAHTNLDNAPGGVSWEMAARIGLQDVRPLVPLPAASGIDSASDFGSASGHGSASDLASAFAVPPASVKAGNPFAPETDKASFSGDIPACPTAHPGSGVIGVLPQPVPAEDFLRILANVFNAPHLRYCLTTAPVSLSASGAGNASRLIRKVALCGGSGGEYIPDAIAAGADCYVTGEIRYHDYFEADGRMLVALGHYESEQYTIDLLCRKLQTIISPEHKIPVLKTTLDTNPLRSL